ncbi:MAG: hypothetical protein JXR31_00365 [Prolixibacteraceae bacterium]|nr:hypothetical protein [Prolixibacteraceae bacterium]MBN2772667.1 hypothetical protein [Prolixibacteraceae bacterium]
MKRISYFLLLLFAVFLFNNCAEDFVETKDINYVSFEGSSVSIVVNKNSTADRTVKVYTTQTTGSDRTFTINVSESTTADQGAYTVPGTVTVPANSNEGEFTVSISDVNIGDDGVKLVLSLASQDGLYTGSNITVNMSRLCPLVIEDFLGDYIITEAGYGDYATTITLDATVANRVWVSNFWDWTNDLVYYDFDPDNGTVTMPSQNVTMGDGNVYNCVGNGTYNACNNSFHVEYGGDVAGTVHDFNPAN